MTPISPAYSREDLIAMIRNRDELVSDLKACLEEAVRERENYNGRHQAAVIEIDRLRSALKPFALEVGAISLSKALGHISREHLLAARDALVLPPSERGGAA